MSCVQVFWLPQSHFDDNRAMIAMPYIYLVSGRFGHFVCGKDVDVDVIYKYLCPVCFLSPHNQEGTLFSVITYVLYPSCFCKIWALCVSWMYLNLSYDLCNLSRCLILKRRSSIDQTLIKIKHKVKWKIEVLKTRNLTPLSSYMDSFLSTTKLLEKIRLHMVFTLFVNILKNFFEQIKI